MALKGEDFLGFTFNGIHSSDLGIVRVSDGDRYKEEQFPQIEDLTAEVPGMDGKYYYGSTYQERTFTISIAFDSMTEVQLRNLRKTFGTKKTGELIFDEAPYKKYFAKLSKPIELDYICFDERKKTIGPASAGVRWEEKNGERVRETIRPYIYHDTTQRIYKGEGEIEFVCYYPFARSVFKELSIENQDADWAEASGILTSDDYQEYLVDQYNNGQFVVYNPGDLDTGFRLYSSFELLESFDTSVTGDFDLSNEETIKSNGTNAIEVSKKIGQGEVQVYDAIGLPITSFGPKTPKGSDQTTIQVDDVNATEGDELRVEYITVSRRKIVETVIYSDGYITINSSFNNIDLNNVTIWNLTNKNYTVSNNYGDNGKTIYLDPVPPLNHNLIVVYNNIQIILSYEYLSEDVEYFTMDLPEKKGDDEGFIINTENDLIIGVKEFSNDSYITTGNLYNDCIRSGYFFKLKPEDSFNNSVIRVLNANPSMEIFYDYLYF